MPEKSAVTIEEFTSPDPVCVDASAKVEEVIALFRRHGFRHLPVIDEGKVVGIISDRDILLARPRGAQEPLQAREVMTPDPYVVRADASLEAVALELSRRKFGSAVVVDAAGGPQGIFTSTDALNALIELLRERE